jgi:hypothetical protein
MQNHNFEHWAFNIEADSTQEIPFHDPIALIARAPDFCAAVSRSETAGR